MTPDETRALLTRFYDALARRDAATMASLYAPDATFDDPAFSLRGEEVGRMWIGLLGRARDFSATYAIAEVGSDSGVVDWTATYLFAGRNPVVNTIRSEIALKDGKIFRQVDRFDFPRWAAQALGLPGRLFGRFAWFRRKVRAKAAAGLGLPVR